MSYVTGVLQTLLPVLLVLGIGMACRRKGAFSREGINTLKNVAVDIALPAVLLRSFATTTYDLKTVVVPLVMVAVCFAGWGLGKAVCRYTAMKNRFIPYLTTGFEAGMLGYTLFTMLYGEAAVPSFALVDLGQVLFVFTAYKMLLGAEFAQGKGMDRKQLLRSMITSPIILAIAAGVLLGATGGYAWLVKVGLSGVFDTCVSFVAAPTSVLILLSIGYDLVFEEVNWKETGKVVAVRFAIMLVLMAVTLLAVRLLFAGDTMLLWAVVVMFILPPPYVLPIFADDEKQYAYISSALTVSTLLSIVCFGVLAFLK